MCVKTNPKIIKCVVGVAIMILIGAISIFLYFGLGEAKSSVVMQGDNNKSKVSQSVGLHLTEVNNSGDSGGCNNWTRVLSERQKKIRSQFWTPKKRYYPILFWCFSSFLSYNFFKKSKNAKNLNSNT